MSSKHMHCQMILESHLLKYLIGSTKHMHCQFSERSNVFKDGNTERSGKEPVIWLPDRSKSCSESLTQPLDKIWNDGRSWVKLFLYKEGFQNLTLETSIGEVKVLKRIHYHAKMIWYGTLWNNIMDDVKVFQERSKTKRQVEKLNLEGLNERIKWSERLQSIKRSSLSFGSLAIICSQLWEVWRSLGMEDKWRWVKEMRLDRHWFPSSILRAPPLYSPW